MTKSRLMPEKNMHLMDFLATPPPSWLYKLLHSAKPIHHHNPFIAIWG